MNELEIRKYAKLMSFVAEMNAVIAGIEGMKVTNTERQNNGYALAYPEECFANAERELNTLAHRMREEI